MWELIVYKILSELQGILDTGEHTATFVVVCKIVIPDVELFVRCVCVCHDRGSFLLSCLDIIVAETNTKKYRQFIKIFVIIVRKNKPE